LDCLTRTVKAEGPLALYKGFFAHLARILPHTVCLGALDGMKIRIEDMC
jgi:hypothetical protein